MGMTDAKGMENKADAAKIYAKMTIDEIAAKCSTCGNCLHACPVYNAEFIEPNSPRGKINLIKALQDGKLEPSALNKKFLYQCMLCGSCQHTCTQGVKFTDMMMDYRNQMADGRKIPALKKVILWFYRSFLFKRFTWVMDIFAKTPLKKKFLIPNRKKAKLEKTAPNKQNRQQYDVLLFPGCVLGDFYPQITVKIKQYLEKKGFSVVVPTGMDCCGFPFISQGWQTRFDQHKEQNQAVFDKYNFKYFMVPCGTCLMSFRTHYNLPEDKVFEITEFFHKFIPDARVNTDAFKQPRSGEVEGKRKVTWHDPCHDLKILGVSNEPRQYMKQLGDTFVDDKSALCCGFGGIFSVGFPDTSQKVFNRKQEKLNDMGVDTVVTACPGCFMQLREKLPQDVKFFIELFDEDGGDS